MTRFAILLIASTMSMGCQTTRVLELSLTSTAVAEVDRLCAASKCSARATQSQPIAGIRPSADSLYSALMGTQVTVELEDERVLAGRLSRFRKDDDRWVLLGANHHGSTVDTVGFRFSDVTGIGSSLGVPRFNRMDLTPEVVRLGQDVAIPRHSLRDLSVSVSRPRHSRGALVGLGLGAVAGGALGALIGAIAVEPCREEEGVWFDCFLEPRSHGEAAALYGLLGGTAGGLSGIIVGALIGTKKTIVYRFRPDTPQQMSVVIGVGPTTSAYGSPK